MPTTSPQPATQPTTHKVLPGDCVVSLAAKRGLDPAAVFQLSENSKLREHNHDVQEILAPGDSLHLPARELRQENRPTGSYHPFTLKTHPARLKVRFLDNRQPRSSLDCIVQIDGVKSDATIDSNGLLDIPIPPTTTEVRVRLGGPDSREDYLLKLGHLDPLDTISGLQARLANLGFDPGPIDNILGPRTRAALSIFQRSADLPVTGEPDNNTRDRLHETHGC